MTFTLHEQVLDNLPDGITIQDKSFNIIYQNKAMINSFGEHAGMKCYSVYERRDEVCEGCGVQKCFQTGKANIVLRTAFEVDGKTSYWENACFPLLDSEGNIIYGVEVCRNITGRVSLEEEVKDRNIELGQLNKQLKQKTTQLISVLTQRETAQEALRESEEKFRSIIEVTTDWVWEVDRNGVYTYADPKIIDFLGYEPEEVLGKTLFSLMPEDEAKLFASGFKRITKSPRPIKSVENTHIHKDGRHVVMETTAVPFIDKDGKLVGWRGANRDITELKRAEEERQIFEKKFHQAEKIEALSRMAGAIAHNFNNQLNVVTGNLELALEDLPRDALPRKNLNVAMRAAFQSAEISGLMLTYLGQSTDKRKPMDLSETCRRNLPILQAAMPSGIAFNSDLMSPGPVVRANANQMQQVLTHLISNAWESIGDKKGNVTLATKTIPASDIVKFQLAPADWTPTADIFACLEVRDSGCGITQEDMDRLFDPFFTTKFTGRGLGLSVVLGIVKAWDGAISVKSTKNQGSTFRVFLPLITGEVPRQAEKVAEAAEKAEGGTVLLVEDMEMVRVLAETMLKRLGFSVLAAANGTEAVALFHEHRDVIRCVFTDLSMPGMDGWETLAALRKIQPHIPAILASGYDEASVMGRDDSEKPHAFLHKPYSMDELKNALNQALRDEAEKAN